jgi:hypothetical protein
MTGNPEVDWSQADLSLPIRRRFDYFRVADIRESGIIAIAFNNPLQSGVYAFSGRSTGPTSHQIESAPDSELDSAFVLILRLGLTVKTHSDGSKESDCN